MKSSWLIAAALVVPLPACSSPQSSDATEPESTSEPTSVTSAVPTTPPPATEPSATATASTHAHAPGGAHCDELAKTCHDVGHGKDEAGKCHEIGHAGDSAACEKEHARCLSVCKKAAEAAGAGGQGKGHHHAP